LVIPALVTLRLTGIAALWLSRSFKRPVFALTQAAERLARVDLSQRVTVQQPDELGRLSYGIKPPAVNEILDLAPAIRDLGRRSLVTAY
jgi:methyl-accepting chemotaxis protein